MTRQRKSNNNSDDSPAAVGYQSPRTKQKPLTKLSIKGIGKSPLVQRMAAKSNTSAASASTYSVLPKFIEDHGLLILTVLSFITRFVHIDYPNKVVFDEVHFGKFASYYLENSYFHDVHPPLGKLMFATVGWYLGYDGSYKFDTIGDNYDTVHTFPIPYTGFRMAAAVTGSLIIPLVYMLTRALGGGKLAAFIAGFMVLFDNGQCVQYRLILLDSFLVFFIFCSFYFYLRFRKLNDQGKGLTTEWFLNMFLCGVSLSCATGVKFVGLFAVAVIGLNTVSDLWHMYCDTSRPVSNWGKHFAARVVNLIAVPIAMFLFWFYLHFAVAYKSGPGDSFMSTYFQSSLVGSPHYIKPGTTESLDAFIAFNSKITLGIEDFGGPGTMNYLHSHNAKWPVNIHGRITTGQQQVTGYETERDPNNEFLILNSTIDPFQSDFYGTSLVELLQKETPVPIKYGDIFQLYHISTGCVVATHDVASAIFASKQEVSCWKPGEYTSTDQEEGFHLFTLDYVGGGDTSKVEVEKSRFYIRHLETPTYMQFTGNALGGYAWNQHEVVFAKDTSGMFDQWVFASSFHSLVAQIEYDVKVPGFWEKVSELIPNMIETNNALSPSHVYSSFPLTWPFLKRGVSYYQDKSNREQIYLLGNFLGWGCGHICMVLYIAFYLFVQLRSIRNLNDFNLNASHLRLMNRTICVIFMGYFMHYAPFLFMGRQLFLHHYLPTIVFTYIITGVFLELITLKVLAGRASLQQKISPVLVYGVLIATFIGFIAFLSFTYCLHEFGFEHYIKVQPAWDFLTGDWH